MIVPFLPAHLKELVVHEYINYIQNEMAEETYGAALAEGEAYSYISDGDVIGCAGILAVSKNKYQVWALLSEKSGKHMTQITKMALKTLNNYKGSRLETHVRCDFKVGIKWVNMLKFINETPDGMKKWGDDGYDYYLYSRV